MLTLNANFWILDGLHFNTSVHSCITTGASSHHMYIQNCDAANIGSANSFGAAFVEVGSGSNNIYILNDTVNRTSGGTGVENDGVYFTSATSHTCVVDGCTFTGNLWDGIGNEANNELTTNENCDYSNNTINGYQDDSIEMDGGSVNARAWGNIVITTTGNSVFSEAGTISGPSYIFRNILTSSPSSSGIKQANDGVGYCFFFHNTVETNGTGGNEALGEAGGGTFKSELHTYWNNIFKSTGNTIDSGGRSNVYDYNLSFRTNTAKFALNFDGADFDTLAAFQAAFPGNVTREAHGLNGDPLLDGAKHITSSSPAFNAGVIIPNFNTRDAPWGYSGAAPDIGAFEVGGFTVDPEPAATTAPARAMVMA